jgi:hypothetical protein
MFARAAASARSPRARADSCAVRAAVTAAGSGVRVRCGPVSISDSVAAQCGRVGRQLLVSMRILAGPEGESLPVHRFVDRVQVQRVLGDAAAPRSRSTDFVRSWWSAFDQIAHDQGVVLRQHRVQAQSRRIDDCAEHECSGRLIV